MVGWAVLSGMQQPRNDRLLLDSLRLQQSQQQKDKARTKFTELEDSMLRQIVLSMPKVNWKIVEQLMGSKNARQCRERYNNYLAPERNTDPWTAEEEAILMEKYKEFGPQWSKMTPFFRNRAAVSIKNQYAKIIYNEKRRGNSQIPPTADEEMMEDDPVPVPVNETVAPETAPEPKQVYHIHESVAKILERTDRLGDAWYKMEEEAQSAQVFHVPEDEDDY